MSEVPLVSVVVPYFETGDFLLEAVDSVKAQTYPRLEIIIVDDGSSESPASAVLAKRKFGDLQVHRVDTNGGAAAAKNLGVKASSGALILCLDADDVLEPEFVERLVALMENTPECAGAFSDVQNFGDADERWTPEMTMTALLAGEGCPNAHIYKRSLFDAVGGYKPHMREGETQDFFIEALKKDYTFAHLGDPLYKCRIHAASRSSAETYIGQAVRNLVREHRELCVDRLQDILMMQSRKYYEQLNLHRRLYQEYMELHGETTKQYEEIMKQYAPAGNGKQSQGVLGRLKSLIKRENKSAADGESRKGL